MIPEENIKINNLILKFDNFEEINIFQKKLLSKAKGKNELEYIFNLNKGFINSLKFIKDNINMLFKFDNKCCFWIHLF